MLRILGYIVAIGLLVAGAVWLADRPGHVTIDWLGWRLEASAGVLLLGLFVTVIAILVVVRLWDAIWQAPRRMMRARAERRRIAGYRALSKGMVAVAAGDAVEARRRARSAHGLLGEPPLTLLLAAQAAQLNGDDTAAQRYFTAMLERSEMRFLGLRGLLNQALARGDHEAALDFARRAQRERPDAAWPSEALIAMQVKLAQWSGAAETINQAIGQKLLEKPTARRQLGALFLEEARELAANHPDRALELTRQALKRRPDLVPAIALEASLLQKLGRGRDARKLIEQAWTGTNPGPHPVLAASYAALEPDEQPLMRARRFETLAAKAPQNRESRLALAETAIAAGLWGPARNALEPVVREEERAGTPSARVCRLMAALEESEHGDTTAARRWLGTAARGAPDPGWGCSACGIALADWHGRCPQCGAFDRVEWRTIGSPSLRAIAAMVPEASPSGGSGELLVLERRPAEPAAGTGETRPERRPAAEPETTPAPQVDAARLVN
jgi:HemY protein